MSSMARSSPSVTGVLSTTMHAPADSQPAALADELFDAVGLLRRRSRRLAGAPFPGMALSGAQLELVRLVRREPDIAVAEAATTLGLAPNTVSTLVGQLVALDVVVRDRHDSDRRVARLRLTDDARRSLERWRDRRALTTTAAVEQLTAKQQAALRRALPIIRRLADALPVDEAPPGGPDGPKAVR
jgi:DNA-binding MarR family transcriptional regulator